MKYLLLVLFLVSDVALGLTIKPKNKMAKVYKEASSKSEVIREIVEQEEADERQGMFFKLTAGGYVSVLEVKPSSNTTLNGAIKELIKQNSVDEGRERTSAMGARGLSSEDISGAQSMRPNMRAVYKMESRIDQPDLSDSILAEILQNSARK